MHAMDASEMFPIGIDVSIQPSKIQSDSMMQVHVRLVLSRKRHFQPESLNYKQRAMSTPRSATIRRDLERRRESLH